MGGNNSEKHRFQNVKLEEIPGNFGVTHARGTIAVSYTSENSGHIELMIYSMLDDQVLKYARTTSDSSEAMVRKHLMPVLGRAGVNDETVNLMKDSIGLALEKRIGENPEYDPWPKHPNTNKQK